MDLMPTVYSTGVTTTSTNLTSGNLTDGVDVDADILFPGYSSALLNFASATCIVFILVGVPGNLITIIALARCKKVRNATAVFIINLSLSDLLFCCFNLPLAASTFWNRAWTHGELLCRLFPLLRYGLLAVSLFTVLAITINRYVMIGHPRIYPRVYRRRYLGLMVAATWVCTFGILVPTWRGVWGTFGLDRTIGSCSILPDENNNSPKQFLFILAFVIPCISIVVCYARIFYIVRRTAMRSHDPKSNLLPSTTPAITPANQMATTDRMIPAVPDLKNNNMAEDPEAKHLIQINVERLEHHLENGSLNGGADASSPRTNKQLLSKTRDDNLKFIDTSVESDVPPSLFRLKAASEEKCLSASDRNLSSVSINNTVEYFGEGDLVLQRAESRSADRELKSNLKRKSRWDGQDDSAVEGSSCSSDNHQVFHITNDDGYLGNPILQVEPSSSSGIDIPMDQEEQVSANRKERRFFVSSIKRQSNKKRKTSTINTSTASILYPGRMTTKDRRLLKMILVIFISFLICYLPITITKIVRSVLDLHILNIMGYLLIYLTTCINPIIYVVMSSEYRQAYVNLLMCRTVVRGGANNGVPYKGSQRT